MQLSAKFFKIHLGLLMGREGVNCGRILSPLLGDGAGYGVGLGCRTGPPRYLGWRAVTTTRRHGRLHPPVKGQELGL
jgi:hypothetical protein